jgi:tRNA (cytidine/uridine-2'-O-)-methyltransferase
MRVALYEPEIAVNVGAVLRLGACLGAAVDLVEPMGFVRDDRRVRRVAMDYIDHRDVARHAGFGAFRAAVGTRRLVLLDTGAARSLYDFSFATDDVLLFLRQHADRDGS